jgi:peptidoglycan hydrolase CwlO-like protein
MTDRIYYRSRGNRFLFEEAKYVPNAELAIVLAERLEDAEAEYEQRLEEAEDRAKDFERDCNRLDDENYELRMDIARMESIIDGMAAEIEQLKETAK